MNSCEEYTSARREARPYDKLQEKSTVNSSQISSVPPNALDVFQLFVHQTVFKRVNIFKNVYARSASANYVDGEIQFYVVHRIFEKKTSTLKLLFSSRWKHLEY